MTVHTQTRGRTSDSNWTMLFHCRPAVGEACAIRAHEAAGTSSPPQGMASKTGKGIDTTAHYQTKGVRSARRKGDNMGMEFRRATADDATAIHRLVQRTITEVYPHYYALPVVDFFCRWHDANSIAADIESGVTNVLVVDGTIVGTGSREEDNRISRVYVLPEAEGQGYGSIIMDRLEEEIFETCDACEVDAAVPAAIFYERRGYRTVEHRTHDIGGGETLVYEVMRKER